ncbi:hypothetical protein [Carboxylicivirga litoralis]|uniref:hypothetical protein n=1 Tax=Carboxylicivirga litoralis TaxID=2816963 RepID=UPI0021CB0437|nr:hypothetical protein [Carboxylicivirga sp. A043]
MKALDKEINKGLIELQKESLFSSEGVYKMRTSKVAIKKNTDNWNKWEDGSFLIVFNTPKERITVYTKIKQVYDVYKSNKMIQDDDGNDIFTFYCVNELGDECELHVKFIKNSKERIVIINKGEIDIAHIGKFI